MLFRTVMAHDRRNHRSERPARSRSPSRKDREHHSHKRRQSPVYDRPLPFSARLLDKHDFKAYKSLFASYLDIQKQIDISQMFEGEAKGRWKSFIKKWNRGELAEGWYDPERLQQAPPPVTFTPVPTMSKDEPGLAQHALSDVDDDDDDYGPAPANSGKPAARAGPSIPTTDDLALKREAEGEDRESAIAQAKASRRADAKLEKQRLDDLMPRAEPGTRERQLEKKRELAASNRAFADTKSGGGAGSGMAEVGESDLMGGGDDDSLEGIRRRKREEERKLSERELKREEYARARREEMDQRKQAFAEKEEERTKRFIELAKRRFG